MRVGVLELLTTTRASSLTQVMGHYLITKQYTSIMPQAVAVWSRQLGHQVFYATYYGQGDPKKLLPDDLDLVFIACYTQTSPLAYALAKLYRKEKTLTVFGGPHAKSFPQDGLRYFDLVVQQCDKALVADILGGAFDLGSVVSSDRTLTDLPSVEERMPEIKVSSFFRGKRPYIATNIALLASVGCPYTCNFCTDWNNPYVVLSPDQLEEDLRYISQNWPKVKVSFHDPNFAIKFDQTLDVLEKIPADVRSPYIMESSLSVLRGPRLQRLSDTNCIYVAPGIESWSSYSNKAGVGTKTGAEKVRLVAEHIEAIHAHVPGMQVNFIFGLDVDEGDEPVELTKEFMRLTPYAWPVVNIPIPFGGTPLYDEYLEKGRILTSMPFMFYYFPYLVTTLKNYDPLTYYRKFKELLVYPSTLKMMWRRLRTTPTWAMRFFYTSRYFRKGEQLRRFNRVLKMMETDPQFRAFHEGESTVLPEFYHQEYDRLLGPYATLLSREDRQPVFSPTDQPQPVEGVSTASRI